MMRRPDKPGLERAPSASRIGPGRARGWSCACRRPLALIAAPAMTGVLVALAACEQAAAPALASAPAATDAPRGAELHVAIVGDEMEITADGVRLDRLLTEVSRRSGLAVRAAGALPERVTAHVELMPFEQALSRVMRDRDYVLSYVPLAAGRSELWVFPRRATSIRTGAAGRTAAASLELESDIADAPTIRRALRSGDSRTRKLAVNAMTAVPGGAGAGGLSTIALHDPDAEVRAQAVRALSDAADAEALTSIDQALADRDADVRAAAVEALGRIGGDDAALALAYAFRSDDVQLRVRAVDELAGIGSATAVTLLEQALGDPEPSVRSAAEEYLEELRPR